MRGCRHEVGPAWPWLCRRVWFPVWLFSWSPCVTLCWKRPGFVMAAHDCRLYHSCSSIVLCKCRSVWFAMGLPSQFASKWDPFGNEIRLHLKLARTRHQLARRAGLKVGSASKQKNMQGKSQETSAGKSSGISFKWEAACKRDQHSLARERSACNGEHCRKRHLTSEVRCKRCQERSNDRQMQVNQQKECHFFPQPHILPLITTGHPHRGNLHRYCSSPRPAKLSDMLLDMPSHSTDHDLVILPGNQPLEFGFQY